MLNSSPHMEQEGSRMMSPAPNQTSPTSRSPRRDAPSPPTMLATMTPVNVMELKKEMDEKRAMTSSPIYPQVKTEVMYEKEDEIYAHVADKNDAPLDLIYEDGKQTVIYTTTPDQKGVEIYSADNININAHAIRGQQIADVLLDGNSGAIVDGTSSPLQTSQGTVSVVLQSNGQGLLQYPQSQVPATVLVLSELVEDMTGVPVVGLRKRSNSLESEEEAGFSVAGHRVMAEIPEGGQSPSEEHQTWRAYYEHPLTAATTAMLNIGGGAEDQATTMGLIYEYYKLPPLTADAKDKLADIWPTSSQAGSILTSQLKATNGLVSGAGLDLAPPLTGQLSPQDIQGLFINQHVGYAPSSANQNLQIVKREPEDLSHHRKLDTSSPGLDGSIVVSKQPRHKVVLLSGQPGDLVVDVNSIKDENHHGLKSPQHGSRSVNGTPTSTHSSLLAEGSGAGPGAGPIEFVSSDGLKPAMYGAQIFTSMSNPHSGSGTPSPIPYGDHVTQYSAQSGLGASYSTTSSVRSGSSVTFSVSEPYGYREYFNTVTSGAGTPEPAYTGQLRQSQLTYGDETTAGVGGTTSTSGFVERYVRQPYHTKGVIAAATAAGLTVDLPSPDSGIGADAITPRDQTTMQQSFDYTELCQTNPGLLDPLTISQRGNATSQSPGSQTSNRSRPWHDFGRQNDADKIQIPKIISNVGFKYFLETPISTSQRREDDRITYINKGQFYGITLEFIDDPNKQLKSQTVKSIVMLMFREEKSPEDEIKAWQFWHGRQHSVKQRILDADTKNSVGLVGCIEEVAHNAIAVYWNPMESAAKINIAVQCLSTDFSSQKGVKGLPLHLQIDTYEDPRDTNIFHRGYCQIKVFCDKGAERKTRDEERRAAKRKMTATGRKKLDELYHPMCERSEFYSMIDLIKPPVLFSPAEDIEKLTSMELQSFYGHDTDTSLNGPVEHVKAGSPFLLHAAAKTPTTPTLKFHNHFPPDADKKDNILESSLGVDAGGMFSPPLKRAKLIGSNLGGMGSAGPPPLNERVMLYVRQESEEVYTPLHVVPPTTAGLLNAIENKYKISASSINNLFRKNKKGILAKMDDDMVAYYCNEDLFLLELKTVDEDLFDITFVELSDH
ncbi:protein grainyhead isoform X2 [Onthophagus taurus]|uniref:protein grainyhead isoform X2 n=1 Tax=Onthophagus taurus TaxID=166361 RepID=UPI0039BE4482